MPQGVCGQKIKVLMWCLCEAVGLESEPCSSANCGRSEESPDTGLRRAETSRLKCLPYTVGQKLGPRVIDLCKFIALDAWVGVFVCSDNFQIFRNAFFTLFLPA